MTDNRARGASQVLASQTRRKAQIAPTRDESDAGPTHSRTSRNSSGAMFIRGSVLECGTPVPLFRRKRGAPWQRVPRAITRLSTIVLLSLTALLQSACNQSRPPAGTPTPVADLAPLTNMVLIKAGSFVRQKQLVTLTHDFWLSKYEVTQADYAAVTGKNPSNFQGDPSRPVEKVRYYEALDYCAAITRRETEAGRLSGPYAYRLPTEAEWEYACRAGNTNLFSFGDDASAADKYAWTLENSEAETHPVGLKQPNPWGLHDIHGNVWEWTLDWFAEYPAGDLKDPFGPTQGVYKVFRGGSWNHAVEFARSRNRFMMPPTNGIYFVGFRLALGHKIP